MTVLGHDPYAGAVPEVTMLALDELLRQSDVVTLHAPDSPDGRPLLGAPQLAMMKPSALLVNTAAAGLVDTEALVAALRAGGIAGAALDVFDSAPLPLSSPLLTLPNVVLTPHLGGATDGTIARYSAGMVEDVLSFLDGKTPPRAVNAKALGRVRG